MMCRNQAQTSEDPAPLCPLLSLTHGRISTSWKLQGLPSAPTWSCFHSLAGGLEGPSGKVISLALPAPLVSLSSQDWGAGKGSLPTAVFTLGEWAGTSPGLRWQSSSSCSQPSLCVGAGWGGHQGQTTTARLRAFQGPGRLALLLGAGPSALGQTLGPQRGPCPLPQQG